MRTFKQYLREDYKYKDAPIVGKFLDLNDIEGDDFNRKMDAYTWDKFLKDAHEGRLPSWFDYSDTAARDKIWEYAKKKSKMNDKDFAEYVKKSITWFPGVNESKRITEANNIVLYRKIDDVKVVIEPDGSYTFWKDGGKTKGAQNRSLHGQQGAVKELMAIGYKPAQSLNEENNTRLTKQRSV